MNVPIDAHHWDAEAGEAIQWIKEVSSRDVSFVQRLTAGDSQGKFLRWLMQAGPNTLCYFLERDASEQARNIRMQDPMIHVAETRRRKLRMRLPKTFAD